MDVYTLVLNGLQIFCQNASCIDLTKGSEYESIFGEKDQILKIEPSEQMR